MAFKGTHERDCQQHQPRCRAARRRGQRAHRQGPHRVPHARPGARRRQRFVQMLGDIVRNSTFPEAELERERQVILHEYIEDEDDPLSTAFKLFDKICFGTHPLAQPVIGTPRATSSASRATTCSATCSASTPAPTSSSASPATSMPTRCVEAARGGVRRRCRPRQREPRGRAGLRSAASRRAARPAAARPTSCSGFPIPSLNDDDHASVVAAALFGEGMSSPLMDQIRERRGLVYYAACSADVIGAVRPVRRSRRRPRRSTSTSSSSRSRACSREHAERIDAGRASSARATRSRCAACARRSGRSGASRTRRRTCSCTAACARAPR